MVSSRIGKLPVLAILVAALAVLTFACSGDGDDGAPPGTGGTQGGTGGAGGDPGTGGSGGVEEPPTPCTSNEECDAAERCDEDEGICVPRCFYDMDCGRDTGTRCDEETGVCVMAEVCAINANCGNDPDFDYCKKTGSCVCVPDQTASERNEHATGVCWRTSEICEPCDSDLLCGGQGSCELFLVGNETAAVCIPNARGGGCNQIPGTTLANPDVYGEEFAGKCIPYTENCLNFSPCIQDSDCPLSRPVCDLDRGICMQGCDFNFETGTSIGCSNDRVCHYTRNSFDRSLLNDCATADAFGLGKCDFPCTDDIECRGRDCEPGEEDCPTADWVCRKGDGPMGRCGPPGCVSDDECDIGEDEYTGFCDLDSGQCVYDACRPGIDRRRGCVPQPYPDCVDTHKCVPPDDPSQTFGTCEPKDCADKGGADLGCNLFEYCVGEPMRSPVDYSEVGDPIPHPQGIPFPGCYEADMGVFCGECTSHQECGTAKVPYEGYTGYAEAPSLCLEWVPGMGNTCGFGCLYDAECPGMWQCTSEGLEVPCEGPDDWSTTFQQCETDNDCSGGSKCVTPIVNGGSPPDQAIEFKVCQCDPNEQNACGSGYTCNAGLGTMNRNPGYHDYLEIKANYCTKQGNCGSQGSCEWFGDVFYDDPDGPAKPKYICASASGVPGARAQCPKDVNGYASRAGLRPWDKYRCVYSQVCRMPLMTTQEGEAYCGPRQF